MKKNVWETYQSYERVNGKDISLSEIETINRSLAEQCERIAQDIVDAVDRNDYVKITLLITKRKQLQTAIEDIEAMYGDNLCTSQTLRNRIADELRDSLEKLNHSAHSTVFKTLDVSIKAFSISNQLQYRAGLFIISHTSNGLLKLANALKKNS